MIIDRIIDICPNLVVILLLAGASAFIAAGETALFALSQRQLAQFRQSPTRTAQGVLRLREDPAGLLSTVLLVSTTVNVLLYAVLAVTVARLARGSVLWSGVFGVVGFIVVVVGAEILPKLLAFVRSAQLAPLVAVPLRALQVATAPIRWVLENLVVDPLARVLSPHPAPGRSVAADELQKLVHVSKAEGLIDGRENAMLHQLMDLAGAKVASLMVPRVDVVAFNLADDKRELVELIRASRLLRIPVYEDNIDNVRGIILARDFLLNRDRPLKELIRPIHFIPEQAGVEALLHHFRATGSQSALVVDEYGGLAGIVAMEDVVEEIVGELYAPDELYPLPPLRRIDDRAFLVDADLDLDDFRRAFDLPIEASRFNTVGGLIAAELGRVPADGDKITLGPATLTVLSMRRRRILQVWLVLDGDPAMNPDLARLLETPSGPVHLPLTVRGEAS